jgi:hypothetical protein
MQSGVNVPDRELLNAHMKRALDAQERNSSRPIVRLPVEISGAILLEAASHIPSWEGFAPSFPCWVPPVSNPRAAVTLSHVCRDWREICVGSPTFWNAPLLRSFAHGLDTEIIARAQDYPLSIFWKWDAALVLDDDDTPPDGADVMVPRAVGALLRNNMSRIRHLFYAGGGIPLDLLEMEAPLLETAYITQGREIWSGTPNTLTLRAVNLHSLALPSAGTAFCSPRFLCPHVTRLALRNPESTVNRHNVVDLLDLLAQFPNVTELSIASSRYRTGLTDWVIRGRPLLRERLPHSQLLEVTLIGDFVISVAILEHLQLSADVRLALEIPADGNADPPEQDAAAAFLRSHMQSKRHWPVSARFSQDRAAWERDVFRLELLGSHERVITFLGGSYFDPYRRPEFDANVPTWMTSIGWDRLQELIVDMPETSNPNLACWIMEMFAASETLSIIRCTSGVVLDALLSMLATPSVHRTVPVLDTIVISGVHMLKRPVSSSTTRLAKLGIALDERARDGRALETLVLDSCGYAPADTASVRHQVNPRSVKEVIIRSQSLS